MHAGVLWHTKQVCADGVSSPKGTHTHTKLWLLLLLSSMPRCAVLCHTGNLSATWAEIDRLASILSHLKNKTAAAAAAAVQPDEASDPGGAYLSLLKEWRRQRVAAIEREMGRLYREAHLLTGGFEVWMGKHVENGTTVMAEVRCPACLSDPLHPHPSPSTSPPSHTHTHTSPSQPSHPVMSCSVSYVCSVFLSAFCSVLLSAAGEGVEHSRRGM